jgi:hypothetical protein
MLVGATSNGGVGDAEVLRARNPSKGTSSRAGNVNVARPQHGRKTWANMKVPELMEALAAKGLRVTGTKEVLKQRLREACEQQQAQQQPAQGGEWQQQHDPPGGRAENQPPPPGGDQHQAPAQWQQPQQCEGGAQHAREQ